MDFWQWLQSISQRLNMSNVPTGALNDWGHNDLEGFANYIGSPVQHIKDLAKKNQKEIDRANGKEVVDEEETT